MRWLTLLIAMLFWILAMDFLVMLWHWWQASRDHSSFRLEARGPQVGDIVLRLLTLLFLLSILVAMLARIVLSDSQIAWD